MQRLIVVAIFGAVMTNAPSASLAQGSGDEQAVRRVSVAWVDAMKAKDVPRLLSMLTADVVFLPPGFPAIRGKAAVEAMYTSFFPQFSSVDLVATIEEVQVSGPWAFAWGTELLTLVPGTGGDAIQVRSRGLSVLKREADGSWRFYRGLTQPLTAAQAAPAEARAPQN